MIQPSLGRIAKARDSWLNPICLQALALTPVILMTPVLSSLISLGPKLSFLTATGLTNNTILLEWQLEFTGGYPVSEFIITVEALDNRRFSDGEHSKRQMPDFLSFSLDPEQAESGSLVTQSLETGRGYMVMSRLRNAMGTREQETYGR